MGKVVVPYMVLSYEDVYWTGVSKDLIDEYNPDVVVLIKYQDSETVSDSIDFQ